MKRVHRQREPAKPKRGARRRPRGRPDGTFKTFMDDDDRFAMAAMVCAIDGFSIGPYDAASRVLLAFSDRPIQLRSLDDIAVQASLDLRHATAKGRAGTLVKKYERLQGALGPIELDWLATSASELGQLATTIRCPDPATMGRSLETLTRYGWGPILARICERIEAAFQTNMPPVDEPLSRAVKAMLAELRENR